MFLSGKRIGQNWGERMAKWKQRIFSASSPSDYKDPIYASAWVNGACVIKYSQHKIAVLSEMLQVSLGHWSKVDLF